jgi:hydrocephalus-inducing protein
MKHAFLMAGLHGCPESWRVVLHAFLMDDLQVSIRNTLDSDVVMSATCSNKQVVVPAKITVPANSMAQMEVGYRPLLVAETEAVLKVDSLELGLFEWKLKLAGLSTNPERSLAFNVPLGSRETQVFRFTHWLDDKADYKCTFKTAKGSAFECLPVISAPPAGPGGVEVSVEVHFEPTAMGESIKDVLMVSSMTGGEYQCPLVGRCLAPKPQGPVECGKGSGTVPFKNVFMQDAEFQYSIDNPAFVVPKATEKIGSKKSTNINVSFKPDAAKGFTQRTGKLTVACPSQTTSPWVFYLQATEAEPGAAKK